MLKRWRALALAACAVAGTCASCSSSSRRAVATVTPRFVDVTAASGLSLPMPAAHLPPGCLLSGASLQRKFPGAHFVDDDATNGELCQMERFAGGVAVGDADGDGRPDVYVTRLDGPGRLFRNLGKDRFADVTKAAGLATLAEPSVGAAFVDVDNDGDEDLVVTTLGGRHDYLFVNDGHGRFHDESVARGLAPQPGLVDFGYSIAVGDYDHDGYNDLYLTEYRALGLTVHSPEASSRLLHNLGARRPGFFEDVTERAGLGIGARTDHLYAFGATFRDFDGDGWPDLWITGDFGTSRLFWNQRNGTFSDGTKAAGVGTEQNGMGSTTGDFDGDGRPDRFVSSIFDTRSPALLHNRNWGRSGDRLYRNVGGRRFVDVTSSAGVRDGDWGWGAAFVDATNTGRLDLVQASGMDVPFGPVIQRFALGPTRYWQYAGGGRFHDVAWQAGLTVTNGRGLAVFDADGDGRLDLLVARPGTSPVLLRNVTPDAGHWLRVVVRGTRSNRDGIGAVVTIRPGGDRPAQTQEVQSVSDYLGQSERIAHFGLGGDTGRVDVEVHFPATGETQTEHDVPVDRVLVVSEPR